MQKTLLSNFKKRFQTRLAAACGVAQPVIARVETGESDPRPSTLLKILAPLGKTLEVVDLDDALLSGGLGCG
ncbi:MAG: helix-turn-helix transcriptional regulator [Slackia sp.]|nr:helix-turn-helix transcriptional regulator [Slackia sp.]